MKKLVIDRKVAQALPADRKETDERTFQIVQLIIDPITSLMGRGGELPAGECPICATRLIDLVLIRGQAWWKMQHLHPIAGCMQGDRFPIERTIAGH